MKSFHFNIKDFRIVVAEFHFDPHMRINWHDRDVFVDHRPDDRESIETIGVNLCGKLVYIVDPLIKANLTSRDSSGNQRFL